MHNKLSIRLARQYCARLMQTRSHGQHSQRFITLPIFYVNGDPHIGHLYTALLGDATHRWETLKATTIGAPTVDDRMPAATPISDTVPRWIFSGGTDEHGVKVARAAQRDGLSPQAYCDEHAARYAEIFRRFNISNTHFLRTTDAAHRRVVEHVWNRLAERGCLWKGVYSGWYSSVDECFYTENETQLTADGSRISIETGNVVEFVKENNYMFTIENFRDEIREWLLTSDVIHPKNFLPAALQHLKSDVGLSVSRDANRVKWGIPVPGDSSQTIYVWLDALANYLTVAGYPDQKDFLWPPDIQIIGKDILKFHAIYWPAFLMAVGLPLPKQIFVHSHWLVDRVKMSKSLGNVVDPLDMAKILTEDGLRYFLLKQGVPHDDCNFTLTKAVHAVNADLVNNLGNLVQRTTVKRMNPQQRYPAFDVEVMEHDLKGTGEKLVAELKTLRERVGNHYESQMFYKGIEAICETLTHANAFFQLHEPWKMSQGPDLSTILFLAYEACRISSVLLQPIVPDYTNKILSRFGLNESERHLDTAQFAGGPSIKIYRRPLGEDLGPVMSRIDYEKVEHVVKLSENLS